MTNIDSDSEENINWLSSDHQVYRSKAAHRSTSSTTMSIGGSARGTPNTGCCSCNAQICLSYFLSVFSSIIIVHGLWLWYITNDRIWLILPATGTALIFIGACLYSAGHSNLARAHRAHALGRGRVQMRNSKNRRFSRRSAQRQSFFESSNLSLNMLPQCFNQHSTNHRYLMLGTVPSTHDVAQPTASPQHSKNRVPETNLDRPSTSTSTQRQCRMPPVSAHTIPIEPDQDAGHCRQRAQRNPQTNSNQARTDIPPPTYEQVVEADQSNFQTL